MTTTMHTVVIFISKYFERIEMLKSTEEGSTGRLIQLCIGYFFFYVIFGVTVKYFTEYLIAQIGTPETFKAVQIQMNMEFLIYSTIGGNLFALSIVFLFRWFKLKSNYSISVLGIKMPVEFCI